MKYPEPGALAALVAIVAGTLVAPPVLAAQDESVRHPVEFAVVEGLPFDGAAGVVIREPGRPDVIAMSDSSASAHTLLEMITLLRAVWVREGVEATEAATYRLRSSTGQSTPRSGPEAAYAASVIERILATELREIPGVGQGRVMGAQVERAARR